MDELAELLGGAVLDFVHLLRRRRAELSGLGVVEESHVLCHHRLDVRATDVVGASRGCPRDESHPGDEGRPEDGRNADHEKHGSLCGLLDVGQRRGGVEELTEGDVDAWERDAGDGAEEQADGEHRHLAFVVEPEELGEGHHRTSLRLLLHRTFGTGRDLPILGDVERYLVQIRHIETTSKMDSEMTRGVKLPCATRTDSFTSTS